MVNNIKHQTNESCDPLNRSDFLVPDRMLLKLNESCRPSVHFEIHAECWWKIRKKKKSQHQSHILNLKFRNPSIINNYTFKEPDYVICQSNIAVNGHQIFLLDIVEVSDDHFWWYFFKLLIPLLHFQKHNTHRELIQSPISSFFFFLHTWKSRLNVTPGRYPIQGCHPSLTASISSDEAALCSSKKIWCW